MRGQFSWCIADWNGNIGARGYSTLRMFHMQICREEWKHFVPLTIIIQPLELRFSWLRMFYPAFSFFSFFIRIIKDFECNLFVRNLIETFKPSIGC